MTQTKGRAVPQMNGHDDTRVRIEARLEELRTHHQRLAEELRVVGTVIGELEAVLRGAVITEGQDDGNAAV